MSSRRIGRQQDHQPVVLGFSHDPPVPLSWDGVETVKFNDEEAKIEDTLKLMLHEMVTELEMRHAKTNDQAKKLYQTQKTLVSSCRSLQMPLQRSTPR